MFLKRLYSSIIILLIFFAIVVIRGPIGLIVFLIAGLFVSISAARELSVMLCKCGLHKFPYLNEIFAAITFLLAVGFCIGNNDTSFIVVILAFFSIFAWVKILISIHNKDEIFKVLNISVVFMILIFPLSFLALIFMENYGGTYSGVMYAVLLILVTKCGDIGGYVVGTIMSKRRGGNHKIVPTISPKKSYEGVIGGLILSVIVSLVLCNYLIKSDIVLAIIIGILLYIGGFIGDLAESSLKRSAQIKDSGNIIPGIGGMMDLVDSLLINAPILYLIITFYPSH